MSAKILVHSILPCHKMSYISLLNGLLTIMTIEGLTLEQTTNLSDWRHHPLNLKYDSYENGKMFLWQMEEREAFSRIGMHRRFDDRLEGE